MAGWLKIAEDRTTHPKISHLISHGAAGFRAYYDLDVLMGWCAAGQASRDPERKVEGRIPRHMSQTLGVSKKSTGLLEKCGLLDVTDDGWQIHNWSQFQKTDRTATERKRRQRSAEAAA